MVSSVCGLQGRRGSKHFDVNTESPAAGLSPLNERSVCLVAGKPVKLNGAVRDAVVFAVFEQLDVVHLIV